MEEFYFKDKENNRAIRGIGPKNDINCAPLDYFKYGHAEIASNLFGDVLKVKSPMPIPDNLVRDFVLQETDKMIEEQLKTSSANPNIHELLTNDTLSYKQQNKLLKGVELDGTDLLWLNKEAQDEGYLLDVYHEEKHPAKFDEKKHPHVYNQKVDGTIEKIGETDMTDGEMRELLQQRKVVQARIYHKGSAWHCFYFTYKGLAGEENGEMGSKPHYHYLSDKSGITWEDLMKGIKDCDMPTSKVHIVINR